MTCHSKHLITPPSIHRV